MNERGFDQGCFGFESTQHVEDTFDCESVIDKGLTILGMSNIFWGFCFYMAITFLCLLPSLINNSINFHKYRKILIIVGFFYSIYLAYQQHFILNEYCALCLISGVISTILFILIFINQKYGNKNKSVPELKILYIWILFIGLIFASADYYYFNFINIKSNSTENSNFKNTKQKDNQLECNYNNKKPFVKNYKSLISDFDIKFGNPNSNNIIIEIFDPNCTHCKSLHEEMYNIISSFQDDVYIVIKPNPLWNKSLQQIQALFIANELGKFKEMLDEQFKRQKPGKGLNLNEIKEIAELIGIDSKKIINRIKKADFLNHIIQENKKVKKFGITSAPTLLLNGKTIASRSRNTNCIGKLIGN
tara:strand:+ start:752 stop:1831 length:1080 start_codon:yes stop_codon:yes gene_type:complete